MKKMLTFDDVLLVPQFSQISSRSIVDLSVKLPKDFEFKTPVTPANMLNITGFDMAKTAYDHKGLALLHRFMSFENKIKILKQLFYYPDANRYIGMSIGVKENDYKELKSFVDLGLKIVVIDVANGDSLACHNMTSHISEKYPELLLIAGNVATALAAGRLYDKGADLIKVGIGSGSICSTRIETGSGIPQFSLVKEIREFTNAYNSTKKTNRAFISDGGIRQPGDACKSLCFANTVMMGSAFSGCLETPGEIIEKNGKSYKEYNGSSTIGRTSRIEGVKSFVELKGSAREVYQRYHDGIQSCCSYQNSMNLVELRENPEFVEITNAGLLESHPHIFYNKDVKT